MHFAVMMVSPEGMQAAIAMMLFAPTVQPCVLLMVLREDSPFLMVWREDSPFLMVLREDSQMRTGAAPPAYPTLCLHHLPNPLPRLHHPRALSHLSTAARRRPGVLRPVSEMTTAHMGRMSGSGRLMVLSEGRQGGVLSRARELLLNGHASHLP